jgi:hypothetical protein
VSVRGSAQFSTFTGGNPNGSDDAEDRTPTPLANGASMTQKRPVETVEAAFGTQDTPLRLKRLHGLAKRFGGRHSSGESGVAKDSRRACEAPVVVFPQPASLPVLAPRPPMQSECLRICQYPRLFESISVLSFGVSAPYDHIEVDFAGGSNVLVDSSIGGHGSWRSRSNCPFGIS